MASTTGNLPKIQPDAVEASIEQAHAETLKSLPKPVLVQPPFDLVGYANRLVGGMAVIEGGAQ